MDKVEVRLLRKAYRREMWLEPHGGVDVSCDSDDDGAEEYLVNPDGPEAAATIAALRGEVKRIREDEWRKAYCAGAYRPDWRGRPQSTNSIVCGTKS